MKNRIRLETVFDAELTELIDDYIHNHLHVLLRGSNEPWLFPGMSGGHKGLATLSGQITKRIQKATGLRLTVHQFRHAAAALILRAKPGNYEYVRRILGHRNIQTTINFYVGLETAQATQEFGEIIRGQLRLDPEAAAGIDRKVTNHDKRCPFVAVRSVARGRSSRLGSGMPTGTAACPRWGCQPPGRGDARGPCQPLRAFSGFPAIAAAGSIVDADAGAQVTPEARSPASLPNFRAGSAPSPCREPSTRCAARRNA